MVERELGQVLGSIKTSVWSVGNKVGLERSLSIRLDLSYFPKRSSL